MVQHDDFGSRYMLIGPEHQSRLSLSVVPDSTPALLQRDRPRACGQGARKKQYDRRLPMSV